MYSKLHQFLSPKIFLNLTRGELLYFLAWLAAISAIWNRLFYFDGQNYWAGYQTIWGDWSSHIPYILNFAYRPFPLTYHPQFWGEPFRYHFAADFISGLLIKIGFSLTEATIIPSIIFMELLIVTLYYFFLKLFNSKITALISSFIFLFNGGLGIFFFIRDHLINQIPLPTPPPIFLLTKIDELGIRWMNFFLAEFIPQRAFLLGVPITVFLLTTLWQIYSSGINHYSRKYLFLLGLIAGLLPVIHLHSFLVILLITFFTFIFSFPQNRTTLSAWISFLLPLFITSTTIIIFVFGNIPQNHFRIHFGSIGPDKLLPAIQFWIINTGIMSILIPIAFLKANKKIRLFYLPFLLIFVIANTLVFQADPWDNRKFLLYWYLASAGLVGHLLYQLIRAKYLILSFVLFYLATISGFIDATGLLHFDKQKYQLFSNSDTQLTTEIRSRTDVNSIFLTAPSNTWIGMTLGRQIVMGWEPWLQNYGYITTERARDMTDIYNGLSTASSLINKYSINYIIVGPTERQMYEINDSFLHNIGTEFMKNDEYTIYEVKNHPL